MASTKREQVYDEQIAPLVGKIIQLCKEHGIPMVFDVQLNDDRERLTDVDENGDDLGPFFCTTVLVGGPLFPHTHERLHKVSAIIKPKPASWAAYTVTNDKADRVAGSEDGYDPYRAR